MSSPRRRQRWRVLAVTAVAAMALAMTACGGSSDEPPGRFDPGADPAESPERFEPFGDESGG